MNFPTTLDTTAWMPHVLAALRHLGPRGEEVRFREIISHIESLADFPGWDTWGTKMKRGKPYFAGHRAVTLTGGRLKKDGMVVNPRRGYYALAPEFARPTEEVLATPAVETMSAVTLNETEPVEVPAEETVVEVPTVKVIVKGDGACYLPPTGAETHESYAAEADLRRVAIENTRCFGLWSPRSSQCGTCPLAGLCQASSLATLGTVAADLDAEYTAEVAKAEAEAERAAERERNVLDATTATPDEETTSTTEWSSVVVPFACVCSAEACKGTIPANATAAHVEGRGVFHTECASAL